MPPRCLLVDDNDAFLQTASLLLERETVDGTDVYRLAGRPDLSHAIPSVPPIANVTDRAAASTTSNPVSTRPLHAERPDSQ